MSRYVLYFLMSCSVFNAVAMEGSGKAESDPVMRYLGRPLFTRVIIPAYASFLPTILRPIGSVAGRAVDGTLRYVVRRTAAGAHGEAITTRATDNLKAMGQAVGCVALAGGAEVGARVSRDWLEKQGASPSFAKKAAWGVRTIGFLASGYGLLKGPVDYFWRLFRGQLPITVRFAFAENVAPAELEGAAALPDFLGSYAVRIREGRADGDLTSTKATMLFNGSADIDHKKALIGSFAREVGAQVPVYFVDYEAVRARVLAGECAETILQDLMTDAVGMATIEKMPLAIICLMNFERWIDAHQEETREISRAVCAFAQQVAIRTEQVRVYRDQMAKTTMAYRPRAQPRLEKFHDDAQADGAQDAHTRTLRETVGSDSAAAIIEETLGAVYTEVNEQAKLRQDRGMVVNCLLVGIGGPEANDQVFDDFRASSCKNFEGTQSAHFAFRVTVPEHGAIAAQNAPVGLPWQPSAEWRRHFAGKDDKGDDEKAVQVTDIPAQTLETWPGHHPVEFDQLVNQFRHPETYEPLRRAGLLASSQRFLLYGIPGTGKTKLVRALAGSLQAPIITIIVGKLKDYADIDAAFAQAKMMARGQTTGSVIVFIDDIDFMCGRREAVTDASKKVLWRMLDALDGFAKGSDRIVVIATSNTPPDQLDPALVRSGRLGKHTELTLPNEADRLAIIRFYINKLNDAQPHFVDVVPENLGLLAAATRGYTPAELETLISEAARWAAYNHQEVNINALRAAHDIMQEQRVHTEHHDATRQGATHQDAAHREAASHGVAHRSALREGVLVAPLHRRIAGGVRVRRARVGDFMRQLRRHQSDRDQHQAGSSSSAGPA